MNSGVIVKAFIALILRILLAVYLVIMISKEAGINTAIFAALMYIYVEFSIGINKMLMGGIIGNQAGMAEIMNKMADNIDKLLKNK